jgi:large subunit ribosomal protein L18
VRARIAAAASRPRLSIHRSSEHIYAQVIDDATHATVASASTLEQDLKSRLAGLSKAKQAEVVGTAVAERAITKGVKHVAFDRGGFRYHGRVQALAEGARQAGLDF